jgi:phosphoribosylaminoimidazolecarboxamide formyltransferase/IMP cyclohydrolase
MRDSIKIQRALISVSDKTGLIPFAQKLASLGVTIISTGGTARQIAEAGIDVVPIDDVTQFPEMMDGRVKTLHPRVHGGLLALRDNDEHVAAMNAHGIDPIDLVCVNLYPFEATVAKPDATVEDAIENIDIGGPSMIRSAAKNHRFVTVVTDASQYEKVMAELDAHEGGTTLELRKSLAVAAYTRTAEYDTAISGWLGQAFVTVDAANSLLNYRRMPIELRYGENPHQNAALYLDPKDQGSHGRATQQLHGNPLSFCNYYDANGALELVKEFDGQVRRRGRHQARQPMRFRDLTVTWRPLSEKAYAGDPLAAFGGIVALNQNVDQSRRRGDLEGQKFLQVIIAPATTTMRWN